MNSKTQDNCVAIVGYGHRMPAGIRTDAEFWRLLSEREIVQVDISERYGRGYAPLGEFSGPGRFASRFEGLMKDGDEMLFDRTFFGISHYESLKTAPQAKMLLSCAWSAIEHAGWNLHSLRNSPTGVFVGGQTPAEANWRPRHGPSEYTVPGSSIAMLANKISYHFNLMGTSASYCTACSAGLSALHAAMLALKCGDCDQALVGSVVYLGSGGLSSGFNLMGVISPDGMCHSFDANANGYMRAEGAFVYALKPLAAAERDGDAIYAVIEATAVNAAGAADDTKGLAPGRTITAPTRHAQIELIRTALARSGISPGEVDYIEAHATGTEVGDRIEGNAISELFSGFDREVPLRVSSVKSNVGHMEAAAFHCSLLKVVLMMQRRTFAPTSRSYQVPNPEIDFDGCPMRVQTECERFPDRPVVMGINSFGFGGANGHCVVREYMPATPRLWSIPLAPKSGAMIPLSARTQTALLDSAKLLRNMLTDHPLDIYTIAGNLSRRRTHFATRTAIAANSRQDFLDALEVFIEQESPIATVGEGEPGLAMVFAGQGTQWAGCGRELYETHPVFRRAIDAIDDYWREHSENSLRDACFRASQSALDECELAQPVIFAIQCALVELFKTWGIYPDCVVGHSSGEVAAAYACGALSLKDATQLAFHRSALQQRTAGSGRMLTIGLDVSGVEQLLDALAVAFRPDGDCPVQVEIACENAPANTVVCGNESILQPIMEELDRRNVQNRLIPGNIAFHSRAMDEIKDDVEAALSFLDNRRFDCDVPFVSSVTGAEVKRLDGRYWWSNIRQRVNFAAAMQSVVNDHRPGVVLELAPHSALQPIIAQCLESVVSTAVSIPTLRRDMDSRLEFCKSLGALYRSGLTLDFAAQYPRPEPIPDLLPKYPLEEQKSADIMMDNELTNKRGPYVDGPLVGRRVSAEHLLFDARLSERDFPWLKDHHVHHAAIMPAAGYIEIVLEALGGVPAHFDEIEFLKPCSIPKTPVRLQTALHPVGDSTNEFDFTISTRSLEIDATGEIHCCGKVRLIDDDTVLDVPMQLADVDTSNFHELPNMDGDGFYERVDCVLGRTFQYGPQFRTMKGLRHNHVTRGFMFDVVMDENLWTSGRREGFVVSPPLLDGGLQIFLYNHMHSADLFTYPRRIKDMTFLRPPTSASLVCVANEPPDNWFDVDDIGQYAIRRGERSSGIISYYDSVSGSLVAHVNLYLYFNSNPKLVDRPFSKHRISWQPKFIRDEPDLVNLLPDGEIQPDRLIEVLENPGDGKTRTCHIIELADDQEPEETIFGKCVDSLSSRRSQSVYWLISNDQDAARSNFDAFNRSDVAVRFQSLDPTARQSSELGNGLLRKGAAELLFVRGDGKSASSGDWEFWREIAVGGGLALVSHAEGERLEPGAGWIALRSGTCATLFQAPPFNAGAVGETAVLEPRWVIGEPNSLAGDWNNRLGNRKVHEVSLDLDVSWEAGLNPEEWPHAADVQAIDMFFDSDPQDPTGERAVIALITFMQALVAHRIGHANRNCRVTVVTRRAVLDTEDARGCALWGAVRSLANEIVEEAGMDFRIVDLGSAEDLETLEWLAAHDLREQEIAVRDGRPWVPRMVSLPDPISRLPTGDRSHYRLFLEEPGQVSGLQMKTFRPPPLGKDDVEIETVAAALNFRDIMVTLGMLPELAYERSALGHEVGMEASGRVRRIGTNVGEFKLGDEVIFLQGGCIGNRAVVNRNLVFPKPERLSMVEAASILSVYNTAYYSLIHLARLGRGQRVLIHSAMGGVGQAAIALARHVGAEIYASAGSESKRSQLLKMGVKAAFDSRSHDWFDGLMEATDGEGVDVVLNSLAGRHVPLCLQALRPGGWHCEIGKVDIYAGNPLGLRLLRKNLRFAAIDMDRLMLDDPFLSRSLSEACLKLIDQGRVEPLPVSVFPYRDYDKALRRMIAGQHEGKLVLEAPIGSSNPDFPIADKRLFLDPDATYLVTGGLGGFGSRVLSYLVCAGARHLTVMDRDPERRRGIDWVYANTPLAYMDEQVEIEFVAGDVSIESDVLRCIGNLRRQLKGVFHFAGALDDNLLANMSKESVARVFAPKAQGALNLHNATLELELDHFVMSSSVASIFGNPGQVNYSAASAFLDGLAVSRRRQGLPALTYNLAAVAEAGMAARSLHVIRMMTALGMPPVSSDFAITNLDFALRGATDDDHIITAVFQGIHWSASSPDYMRFGRLMTNQNAFESVADDHLTVDSVMEQIAEKVAELCGHQEGGMEEALSSFGLNSISVAELGAFIQSEFNFQASALELMTTASCKSLAQAIVHGEKQDEGTDARAESDLDEDTVQFVHQRRQPAPSVFASPLDDHFPKGHQPNQTDRQVTLH